MAREGIDPSATEAFGRRVADLAAGSTGMVPETTIEPYDVPAATADPGDAVTRCEL